MTGNRIDGRSLPGGVPSTLGKYTLLARLAAGGMGEVYVARMSAAAGFEKNVVIKRLLPQFSQDEQFVQMFIDEARLTARLNHPNICQVFELVEHSQEYYLVMEYLEGLPLSRIMATRAPRGMDLRIAAGIGVQACEGLAYAHDFRDPMMDMDGIIHRDVSPHNLMLTTSGLVKLLDFGVAKLHREGSLTVTGSAKGKYGYMSPEQIECHPLDQRSDLFSLGVVLFEIITGKRLFRHASDLATLQAIVNGQRPRLSEVRPDVPDAVERVVDRALSVKREQRFTTARMLAEALTHAAQPLGGPATLSELARFLTAEHIIDIESQRALIASASAQAPGHGSGAAQASRDSSRSSRRRMSLPLMAPEGEETRQITGSGINGLAVADTPSDQPAPASEPVAIPALPSGAVAVPALPAEPPLAEPAAVTGGHNSLSGVAIQTPVQRPIQRSTRLWLPLLLVAAGGVGWWMWRQQGVGSAREPAASASGPQLATAEPGATPDTRPAPGTSTVPDTMVARPPAELAGATTPASENSASGDSATKGKGDDTGDKGEQNNSATQADTSADSQKNAAEASKAPASKSRTSKRRRRKPRLRDTAAAATTAAEDGYFTVDASPYAEIYIDKHKMGVTPLVHVKLSAGEHSLRAVSSQGGVKRMKIRIAPGKTTKKRIVF